MNWHKISLGDFFYRKIKKTSTEASKVDVLTIENFRSKALGRSVRFDIYLPKIKNKFKALPLLLFNDGQDMPSVGLIPVLDKLYSQNKLKPLIVVGIHAGNRIQEYGTAHQPDYKTRGSKAPAYTKFIIDELLPYLRKRYAISNLAEDNAIAGFSLGGLSALDIAWNHPRVFGKIGVFSGSLWWRSKAYRPEDPDADRIVHEMVAESEKREGLKFWLQTGTKDEEADRNNNGIIDSIDDTLDLIRALKKLGYKEGKDIRYVEVIDGEHNPQTWGKVLPDFLLWLGFS